MNRERARALAERLLDIAKLHRTDQAFSDLDGRWEDANKQRETAKTIEDAAAFLRSLTEQEGPRFFSFEWIDKSGMIQRVRHDGTVENLGLRAAAPSVGQEGETHE